MNELKSYKQRKSLTEDTKKETGLPLEGIRVLAFERVWAAPFGTRYLADFGAEVIKVESTRFSDGRVFDKSINPSAWLNTNSTYGEINRNKKFRVWNERGIFSVFIFENNGIIGIGKP